MNVLICDDMETDRANLRAILGRLGHNVDAVTNGAEAVSKANATKPQVIFLDVVMPQMDGFATCRALKAQESTKGIPVVMCTSKGTKADQFWAQQQGAAAFVVKPATDDAVKQALQSIGMG